jgi:hypothetical protein
MKAREAAANAQARIIIGMARRGEMEALKWRKPRNLMI